MADLDALAHERRSPPITHPSYLALTSLTEHLTAAVDNEVSPLGTHLRVLDVGCGIKPYEALFAPHAAEYVGADAYPGPRVEVVAPAEALPLDDASFDVVLCTQTLEHVPDPAGAIAEMQRVLRPGGLLLLTTHGTAVYHPVPTDFWRWTQEGLEKVVRDNGPWASIQIEGCGGTAACFGYLIAFYVSAALQPRPLRPVRAAAVALVNGFFGALDRVVPLRHPRPYTLLSNFAVTARKG